MKWNKVICIEDIPKKKDILLAYSDHPRYTIMYYDHSDRFWTTNGHEVSDEYILDTFSHWTAIYGPR